MTVLKRKHLENTILKRANSKMIILERRNLKMDNSEKGETGKIKFMMGNMVGGCLPERAAEQVYRYMCI